VDARETTPWNSLSDLLRQQEDARLTICVVGEFRSGKSTLINALLRANVSPARQRIGLGRTFAHGLRYLLRVSPLAKGASANDPARMEILRALRSLLRHISAQIARLRRRQRAAWTLRIFLDEISWYVIHGCHPPAASKSVQSLQAIYPGCAV
jgi:Dynamin family